VIAQRFEAAQARAHICILPGHMSTSGPVRAA
jgi:hypothetical protein